MYSAIRIRKGELWKWEIQSHSQSQSWQTNFNVVYCGSLCWVLNLPLATMATTTTTTCLCWPSTEV